MDSREAAERARLAETFLFRGAPPEAVELARTDPRTLRQENGKGGVIYAPHAFRRCLGVVLEGRVQVNKGALIMSVLEPGDRSIRLWLLQRHAHLYGAGAGHNGAFQTPLMVCVLPYGHHDPAYLPGEAPGRGRPPLPGTR